MRHAIRVHGYVKSDGTHVKGYTRHAPAHHRMTSVVVSAPMKKHKRKRHVRRVRRVMI
jgi:hypothetical protein